MHYKHLLLIIFVMIIFGSVYPLGKLGTNTVPPILFSSLRVLLIFIGILPFIKLKLPQKNLIFPLLAFSVTMGIGVYLTLYLALENSSILAFIGMGFVGLSFISFFLPILFWSIIAIVLKLNDLSNLPVSKIVD